MTSLSDRAHLTMKVLVPMTLLLFPVAVHADEGGGVIGAVAEAIASAMDTGGGDD